MREKAAYLVSRIAQDLPDFTVHDVTHLDALWEMGSVLTENISFLNPPEAFVFGGAVLLHDAAMTLAAYPDRVIGLKRELVWQDCYARFAAKALEKDETPSPETERLATAEALRRLHPMQAAKLPFTSWCGSSGHEEFLIDDPQVRTFYGPHIGRIAQSHWWPAVRLEEEFSSDLGALAGRTKCRIDLLKIACLLRVSDAAHLDQRRAPEFLRKLARPKGIANDHWEFQGRMAVPYIRDNALVYSASPAFALADANAWWLAFDALAVVDEELRAVDKILQRMGKPCLLARRVEGMPSPTDLARYLPVSGWSPVDTSIRISDVPKIVETLGGFRLYGDKPAIALRELVQNAADAVVARRNLQQRALNWGRITVKLDKREGEHWLTVDDNGVGMSPAVMTGPLIDFGNSLWRSPLAADELPGLQASGMKAVGRFGIGFFSAFMLGDWVRVTSRRYNQGTDSGTVLEFSQGLGSRPILYNAGEAGPVDGGTRVEIRLLRDPRSEGGLLFGALPSWLDLSSPFIRSASSNDVAELRWLVPWIAPALNVDVVVIEDGRETPVIAANDWLNLEEAQLLSRLVGDAVEWEQGETQDLRLRQLVDSDGVIYGRAKIELGGLASEGVGCVTIGGLRATELGFFQGVMLGKENTASRNDAVLLVPGETLAAWATEQAQIVSGMTIDGEVKSRAANIVLMCAGDICDLPIARLDEDWLVAKELEDVAKARDRILLHNGINVRYDDEFRISLSEFEENIVHSSDVIFIANDSSIVRRRFGRKGLPFAPGSRAPHTVFQLALTIIANVRPDMEKGEWIPHEVASVNGASVEAFVLELRRRQEESE